MQGYLKKLCGEKSFLFSPTFEMRFCVLDINRLTFKYAKSPKELFTEIEGKELTSCEYYDKKKHKAIKIKNQSKNGADLRNLLYLHCEKRTFVLSANTKTEQVMWYNGFQNFFKVKAAFDILTKANDIRENKFHSELN